MAVRVATGRFAGALVVASCRACMTKHVEGPLLVLLHDPTFAQLQGNDSLCHTCGLVGGVLAPFPVFSGQSSRQLVVLCVCVCVCVCALECVSCLGYLRVCSCSCCCCWRFLLLIHLPCRGSRLCYSYRSGVVDVGFCGDPGVCLLLGQVYASTPVRPPRRLTYSLLPCTSWVAQLCIQPKTCKVCVPVVVRLVSWYDAHSSQQAMLLLLTASADNTPTPPAAYSARWQKRKAVAACGRGAE
jgi:hypothetical protein